MGRPTTTVIEGRPVLPGALLLAGVVGSTAYGLAGPDSDVDRLGVYAASTVAFHGLRPPTGKDASRVTTGPDATYHEALKYAGLALGCNPTAMELMWLPDNLYEVRTPLGDELIDIRSAFLSAKRVRDAYLGYATQQFRKLEARGNGTFSSDTAKRTAKHARHLARLIDQGVELHLTGRLRIRLEDPDGYRRFGQRVADGDVECARETLATAERVFSERRGVLPEGPDEAVVEDWLRRVRLAHLR